MYRLRNAICRQNGVKFTITAERLPVLEDIAYHGTAMPLALILLTRNFVLYPYEVSAIGLICSCHRAMRHPLVINAFSLFVAPDFRFLAYASLTQGNGTT